MGPVLRFHLPDLQIIIYEIHDNTRKKNMWEINCILTYNVKYPYFSAAGHFLFL